MYLWATKQMSNVDLSCGYWLLGRGLSLRGIDRDTEDEADLLGCDETMIQEVALRRPLRGDDTSEPLCDAKHALERRRRDWIVKEEQAARIEGEPADDPTSSRSSIIAAIPERKTV